MNTTEFGSFFFLPRCSARPSEVSSELSIDALAADLDMMRGPQHV
jgi:hypothetical protein